MRVSEISKNKVKIVLTDTEVLCCFTSYEKLFSMTDRTKNTIKALLRDIIEERYDPLSCKKVSAEIHAGKNLGCIIIVTVKKDRKTKNSYIFEFSDSESLIAGATYLYRKSRRKKHSASLYKMPDCYRLIISSNAPPESFGGMKEFCRNILNGNVHGEYTKEYGKAILTDNAVSGIAKAFIKGS